ncbi:DNA double-strand break repair nuclease NurA [Candidatus Alkanophaga liquidiphilum]
MRNLKAKRLESLSYELPLEYFAREPYPALLERIMRQSLELRLVGVSAADVETLSEVVEKRRAAAHVDEDVIISGVDGGSNGKSCEGIYVGVASALAYTSPLKILKDESPTSDGSVVLIDAEDGEQQWLSLFERHLTVRVAASVVVNRRPDWLLLDGGLILRPQYLRLLEGVEEVYDEGVSKYVRYEERLHSCLTGMLRLLELCERRHTKILGVVKRPTARLLAAKANCKHRDSVLLDKFLDVGEFVVLDVGENPMLQRYEEVAGKNFEIRVAYIKTSKAKGPIRVEFPKSVEPEEAMSLILADSDVVTGVPAHILRADSLVRIHKDTFKAVFSRLVWNNLHALEMLRPQRGEEFELEGHI